MQTILKSVDGLKVELIFSDNNDSTYSTSTILTIKKDGETVLRGLKIKTVELKRLARSL